VDTHRSGACCARCGSGLTASRIRTHFAGAADEMRLGLRRTAYWAPYARVLKYARSGRRPSTTESPPETQVEKRPSATHGVRRGSTVCRVRLLRPRSGRRSCVPLRDIRSVPDCRRSCGLSGRILSQRLGETSSSAAAMIIMNSTDSIPASAAEKSHTRLLNRGVNVTTKIYLEPADSTNQDRSVPVGMVDFRALSGRRAWRSGADVDREYGRMNPM
jgi:hypothetical protein